eukprot:2050308-Prymnesium_polylepis.1
MESLFGLSRSGRVLYGTPNFARSRGRRPVHGGGGAAPSPCPSRASLEYWTLERRCETTLLARESGRVAPRPRAPPPSKTDTHFIVRRQCIETRSCCGGGCRWVGHGSGAQPKEFAIRFHPSSSAHTPIRPCRAAVLVTRYQICTTVISGFDRFDRIWETPWPW